MSDRYAYGGQAVIEGVMMRSPGHYAIACRRPDGRLIVHAEPVENTMLGRVAWLNRPFLRGTLAIMDALALGLKALAFAASVQATAEAELSEAADRAAGRDTDKRGRLGETAIGITLVVSLLIGIALFVALPTAATQLIQRSLGADSPLLRNIVDGVLRIAIFIAYVLVISLGANIRRVFQYHGAEHKAINAWEQGLPLDLASALSQSRIHPRCGTSFVVVVLLASIVVHSIFPRPENTLVRIGLHLALLPIVAGLAYELIRLAGRLRNPSFLRILLTPGLWSQRLTTREPEPDQVEVALAALRAVVQEEEGWLPTPEALPTG